MASEVMLETTYWNRPKIYLASLSVINLCIKHLPWIDPKEWDELKMRLYGAVRNDRSITRYYAQDVEFPAQGYSLIFRGAHHQPVPFMERGKVVFRAPEPKFEFVDNTLMKMSPRYRDALYRLVHQIMEEAHSVYKIEARQYPLAMIFPRSEYSFGSESANAMLI